MIDNAILRVIRERRTVRNFAPDPVTDDQLEAVLEAGRWAPSGRNSQPWDFIVVRDRGIRAALGAALRQVTFSWGGMAAAPVLIVVSVDPSDDPTHFVEDGAVAAQNMCLAAQSLGLGSGWAGVYGLQTGRKSVESLVSGLVGLPKGHRVIAVVPVGTAGKVTQSTRRPLAEIVHHDRYTPHPERAETWDDPPYPSVDGPGRNLGNPGIRQPVTQPGRFG